MAKRGFWASMRAGRATVALFASCMIVSPSAVGSDLTVDLIVEASKLITSIKDRRDQLSELERMKGDELIVFSTDSERATFSNGTSRYDCGREPPSVTLPRSILIAAMKADLDANVAKLREIGVK